MNKVWRTTGTGQYTYSYTFKIFEAKGKFFTIRKEALHNQYKRQWIIAPESIRPNYRWQRVTRITPPPYSIGLESPEILEEESVWLDSRDDVDAMQKKLTENWTPLIMSINYTDSRTAQNSSKLFNLIFFYSNIFCFNLLRLFYVGTLSNENNIKTVCYIPHFLCYFLIQTLIKLSIFQSLSLWILNRMAEGIPGI